MREPNRCLPSCGCGDQLILCLQISKRLQLLEPMLHEFTWRGAELYRPLFSSLLPFVGHPYQQVRDSVGTCITTIFRVAWEPPRVDESGRAIADRETKPIALLSDAIGSILEQLKVTASPDLHDCTMSSAAEIGNENGSESTDVKPLKLAFLNCILKTFPYYDTMFISPFQPYLVQLLPQLFDMQEDADSEVLELAGSSRRDAIRWPTVSCLIVGCLDMPEI